MVLGAVRRASLQPRRVGQGKRRRACPVGWAALACKRQGQMCFVGAQDASMLLQTHNTLQAAGRGVHLCASLQPLPLV